MIVFIIQLGNTAKAQVYDKVFKACLVTGNFEFKMPQDYHEINNKPTPGCWDDNVPIASIIYTIANEDSSVVIGFFTIRGNPYYDGRTAISNITSRKIYFQDTIEKKSVIHSVDYARSAFNAEIAIEYSRRCTQAANGFSNITIVSIGNTRFGEGNMIYFYKDKVKPDIDKIIQGNTAMLRFKTY